MTLELFGDTGLATDRFSHVAVVLTRAANGSAGAGLWIDGLPAADASAPAFGALPGTPALSLGPDGTGFRGVLDEIRISSLARSDFAPVLGEGDEHYRRRLGLFRDWVLPTASRLQSMLNEIVGTVGGFADPLVVDDTGGTLVRGSTTVRVVPAGLAPGESIAASGRRGVVEAELYDPDADDGADATGAVDPQLLTRHDRTGVVYAEPPPRDLLPGEAAPDPHLMTPALAAALDALLALTGPAAACPLTVDTTFDPRIPGPHATGRAVLLHHLGFHSSRLAALAHRAGFDLVRNLPRGGRVYASCAPGPLTSVLVRPATGADPTVGQPAAVSLLPVPPDDAEVTFRTIELGPATAVLVPGTAGPAGTASTATLTGLSPGPVVVIADLTFRGRTRSASSTVVVRPAILDAGAAIAADGTLGAGDDVVGPPESTLDPALLDTVQDPRITFGAGPDTHRMQRGTSRRLRALLDRLGAQPAGALTVSSAHDSSAGAPTLARRGRALTVRHSAVDAAGWPRPPMRPASAWSAAPGPTCCSGTSPSR